MKITVQTGLDATRFQQLMYSLAIAGAEADAKAAQKRAAERVRLSPKAERATPQRSLFD